MVVPSGDTRLGMRWRSTALSDRGMRRDRNEDAFLHSPESHIYAVADGMGGHAAGDIASRLAVEVLSASFESADGVNATSLAEHLVATFADANAAILQYARDHPSCSGMGTTLTALSPLPGTPVYVLAHVGDSRAYRMRNGELLQLTRDHTWVQQQVDAGMLTASAARHHRLANVLNRVLGTPETGHADTLIDEAEAGDLFLLCSDGLTAMIEDADLHAMLARDLPLEQHARQLIDAANVRGGADNITVLLLQAEFS